MRASRWIVFLMVTVVFLWRFSSKTPKENRLVKDPPEKASVVPSPKATLASNGVTPSAPRAQKMAKEKADSIAMRPSNSSQEEREVETQRYPTRKMDLPMPESVQELLSHLTEFRLPKVDNGRAIDGAPNGRFRGYYRNGKVYLRFIYERTWGPAAGQQNFMVLMEWPRGAIRTWSSDHGQVQVHNFKGDPYSWGIQLQNGPFIYLKLSFISTEPSYEWPMKKRLALRGWVLASKENPLPVHSIALVDASDNGEDPDMDRSQVNLPPLDVLAPLFPAELPTGLPAKTLTETRN